MKKVFLALAVVASFVACNSSENKTEETPKTDSTVVVTDSTKVVTTDTTKTEPVADTAKKETETKVEVEKKP